MKYRLKILLLLLASVLLQSGCSSQAAYTDESFASDSPFKMKVDGEVATACESARRSLLGQGYLIDLASSEEVKGRKAARGEGKQNTFIEMNVVCVPERSGSTIFATGVFSTYALKTNSSSASVGLSALGSISLPIGQSVDSLVKVSEQTIDDKDFYKRFFAAVDSVLGEMDDGVLAEEPEAESVEEAITYDPAPSTTQSAIWPALFPEENGPASAPVPSAEQAVPELVPEPSPAESGLVTTPTTPELQPSAPVGTSQSAVVGEPAVIPIAPAPISEAMSAPTAPAPTAEPLDSPPTAPSAESASSIAPTPVPDEEPLGISPAVAPDEEPMGIPPAPVAAQGLPAVGASELAPVQVTAVKKAAPKPTGAVVPGAATTVAPTESPTDASTAPASEPQQAPASSLENLF